MHESMEKDTIVCGSGTWVCMHDAWARGEGHGMVRMQLP
jgi:hypothetical protein